MARFDLFALPGDQGYVVDVQSDHASSKLRTRVVVPLIPLDVLGKTIAGLNPIIGIEGHDYVFAAQSLATLTVPEMGRCIGSLMAQYGDALTYALDILLTGF
ncbi:MAG TPA: CcdB family protein [Rhodopila sp.]|jgi:toxin CcdB|nr:CcdB family protein [Rhodopila sp.]